MGYFLQENIPGIHFIGIKKMAERYGLPLMPLSLCPSVMAVSIPQAHTVGYSLSGYWALFRHLAHRALSADHQPLASRCSSGKGTKPMV